MTKPISKKILALCITALLILSAGIPVFAASQPLSFNSDGKFTILQITDPQDDQNPAHELPVFIAAAIKTAKPDLVVFTGDIVEDSRIGDLCKDDESLREGVTVKLPNGELDYEKTLANVKAAADAVFAPVEAEGIPFAVTEGNNDYNSGITNEDRLKIYASYPHCITVDQSPDPDGKIDSYAEIKKYNSNETGYGLWLLDNGRSFTDNQAEWFNSVETNGVPSIVFEHIPVSDIGNLFEECSIFDTGAVFNSTKTYRLNKSIANGVYYTAYAPGETSSQFTAWKAKNVQGAFFGHIHSDGYTGEWDSITLGVTYGCEFAKSAPYGCRTITLSEDGSFTTQLYTYNNSEFSLQTDEQYPEYKTKLRGLADNLIRLLKYLCTIVLSAFNLL